MRWVGWLVIHSHFQISTLSASLDSHGEFVDHGISYIFWKLRPTSFIFGFPKCICRECIFPKYVFAKCTRLTHLLKPCEFILLHLQVNNRSAPIQSATGHTAKSPPAQLCIGSRRIIGASCCWCTVNHRRQTKSCSKPGVYILSYYAFKIDLDFILSSTLKVWAEYDFIGNVIEITRFRVCFKPLWCSCVCWAGKCPYLWLGGSCSPYQTMSQPARYFTFPNSLESKI